MFLSKAQLINKKISNFLKIDANVMVWIFVWVIGLTIISVFYHHLSNNLETNNSLQISSSEIITQDSAEKRLVEKHKLTGGKIFGMILFIIFSWFALWLIYLVVGRTALVLDVFLMIFAFGNAIFTLSIINLIIQ